jgi:predicted negative regulator of RcsB-dependent stress response
VDTEQEELEALQKWWHENGKAVVIGLVIGLGGVFGWTTWQSRVEATAERVSVVYQSMVDMAAADDHLEALLRVDQIIRDHPESDYAALSGLLGAKSALAAGRTDDANRLLAWVIQNATRTELRDLARLRSAQLLLDEQKREAGLAMVAEVDTPAFTATAEELRGDILMDSGQSDAAAKAYESALGSDSISSGTRVRVEMKLDDLGHRQGIDQSQ